MKTEVLKELGLTDEQIGKVMRDYGKDIEAQKARLGAKDEELSAANKSIADLQEAVKKFDGVDVDALKKSAADWEAKYGADIAALKLDSALEGALLENKARNTKAVKALLDTSGLKLDGGKLLGLDDQLTKLKSDAAYLFDEPEASPEKSAASVDTGAGHGASPGGMDSFVAAAYKGAGIPSSSETGKT